MEVTTAWGLVLLFVVHFVAFAVLSIRRRTWRYGPALTAFALLVALNTCKALGVGGAELHAWLRGLALVALAGSIWSWWRARGA